MRVLLISPGYPPEMPRFTRSLAEAGAKVLGIGDTPAEWLPEDARVALERYHRIPSLWDEESTVQEVRKLADELPIDRVECLWEPGMILAARLREALATPGLTVEQTIPFRDKERMKQVLDEAGIRTPRHARATTEGGIWEAAEHTGFPLIVKPIAGAGSADTHRANDPKELEAILPSIRHVSEMSVEEFIEAEEFTFDTICADGKIVYYNMSWYRPRPLIQRTVEWISPQTVALRDVDDPKLDSGRRMGEAVIAAMGYQTGFTHMEWFRKDDGEAVFGEIAARPPGARSVDIMVHSSGVDVFRGWANAIVHGKLGQPIERTHNAAVIFKRARGTGRIRHIEGLERLMATIGHHICDIELLPIGAPRRNWKQTLVSDGFVMVRHPDLATTCMLADKVGTDLQLHAGW